MRVLNLIYLTSKSSWPLAPQAGLSWPPRSRLRHYAFLGVSCLLSPPACLRLLPFLSYGPPHFPASATPHGAVCRSPRIRSSVSPTHSLFSRGAVTCSFRWSTHLPSHLPSVLLVPRCPHADSSRLRFPPPASRLRPFLPTPLLLPFGRLSVPHSEPFPTSQASHSVFALAPLSAYFRHELVPNAVCLLCTAAFISIPALAEESRRCDIPNWDCEGPQELIRTKGLERSEQISHTCELSTQYKRITRKLGWFSFCLTLSLESKTHLDLFSFSS